MKLETMQIRILTEEQAADMFLKGDSSGYSSDVVLIEKINKGNNIFKGVWFSFRCKSYFLKASSCKIWEYKSLGVNKAENFFPSNDLIASYENELIRLAILKEAGLFKFEDYYKGF